ncbi:MAG: beta-galactosidase [bacterium]
MLKFILKLFVLVIIIFIAVFYFFGRSQQPEKINYGISFSQKYAQELGLDWQEAYLALLDDLGIKKLRLIAYWDLIEPEQGIYNFQDLDWQITEASKRGAQVVLAVGYKLPRWPECHIPEWAQKQDILEFLEQVIKHYRDMPIIIAWQIENEPFTPFGICPKLSVKLLDKEVYLVKAFDDRPVILTDSGELSVWLRASRKSDIFGTTLYKTVWNKYLKYIDYPIPAWLYSLRAKIIRKPVIVSEMQAEPWGPKAIREMELEEQFKSMSPEKFRDIVDFEKQTGISEVYLWGAEWWFWLKNIKGDNSMWEEVRKIL